MSNDHNKSGWDIGSQVEGRFRLEASNAVLGRKAVAIDVANKLGFTYTPGVDNNWFVEQVALEIQRLTTLKTGDNDAERS